MRTPSPFESFNARALAAEAVAKTFIPSDRFSELATRSHSVVVGPRGSGKTSLLKMLQTRALESWEHDEAQKYRDRIDYSGVFIPTDVAWQNQLENLGFGHLDIEDRQRLCIAAFSAHVLHSLLAAFLDRLERNHPGNGPRHRRISLDEKIETALVKELAHSFYLTPAVNSIQSLKHATRFRIGEIWRVAKDEAYLPKDTRAERFSKLNFLNLHFLQAAGATIEVFNDAACDSEGRWALLFDELELAPDFILQELLKAFRSFDDRLLIKISLSPYSKDVGQFRATLRAMPGQDYNEIKLWYAHKEDGYSFGRQLLRSLLQDEGLEVDSIEDVFGESPFERDSENAYKPGSIQYETIRNAISNDPSFRDYFRGRKLNIDRLGGMGGNERAAAIRKIYPTLLLREFFRTPDHESNPKRQELRSRKNPSIFGGATGLLAMAEGNPRWLIGITQSLLHILRRGEKRISLEAQTEQVLKTVHRFRALLKLIPVSEQSGGSTRSVLNILDRLGEFFHDSVVLAPFRPEPYGAFTVDSHTSDQILEALGLALNAGAIVFVPDNKAEVMVGSLRGKRFRLSYLLSPFYEIPIRLGGSLGLSKIFSLTGREPESTQTTLL